MGLKDFHDQCAVKWQQAITKVAPIPADSTVWNEKEQITAVLKPFMGAGANHAHLPTGGGLDFLSIEKGGEPDCLTFLTGDNVVSVMKPATLTLEYIPAAPRESFLLLELAKLKPCGANNYASEGKEEVLEYPKGEYLSRDIFERGYLRHDEHGREIPLPKDSRLVVRWFGGKVLFVCKGSLWNGTPATYDGRHNAMTAALIREMIKRNLPKSD